jgi:hypothetical protein
VDAPLDARLTRRQASRPSQGRGTAGAPTDPSPVRPQRRSIHAPTAAIRSTCSQPGASSCSAKMSGSISSAPVCQSQHSDGEIETDDPLREVAIMRDIQAGRALLPR